MKLFVVGERSLDAADWNGSYPKHFVIASTKQEAIALAGESVDAVEVPLAQSGILLTIPGKCRFCDESLF